PHLHIEHFRMKNGLDVLLLKDKSAPVISFHTWFRVGSRHEKPGKTGLAHLFEHLMFNEVEGLPAGAFDKKMEAAGADNNASTWLDFTQYQEAFPKQHLKTVIELESKRMHQLVLREPQVDSEKEVVKNERLFRVDDDVEGFVEELLWKTAFTQHSYHWPTIGFMQDIEGFTIADCEAFYRAYYAPNNATAVVVGDLNEQKTLSLLRDHYGHIPPSVLPVEDIAPEPPQDAERRVHIDQPTTAHKLAIGYKGPALGDRDHVVVSVLLEILAGGKASRLHQRLVRDLTIASEVAGFVGPHHHPSLIEFSVSARAQHTAQELLDELDRELDQVINTTVSDDELTQAIHRMELSTLCSLESADAKASSIGFYFTLLGAPGAVFDRLQIARTTTPADLRFAARRFLSRQNRTVIFVAPRPTPSPAPADEAAVSTS
ncbi:MAG TPA: pitrilysin family protein, partial [Polyangiaceae bacterium]|nr:pitrilysin family protein [Polyangiaceae bacterium]